MRTDILIIISVDEEFQFMEVSKLISRSRFSVSILPDTLINCLVYVLVVVLVILVSICTRQDI